MPRGAPARILPKEESPEHLSLVDNIGIGDDIMREAQKKQADRLDALEEGAPPNVVRLPRRRRTAREKPPVAPVEVSRIDKTAKRRAMELAGGDWTRCQPINRFEIVVHNHPIRKKKTSAGRTRSSR